MPRINPFDEPAEAPVFATKPAPAKPVAKPALDQIAQIARDQNFPSRQAPRAAAVRKRRTYTTGRNQQLNFKVTAATVERFYRLADARRLPLCETLELALDALERQSPLKS